jgi:hypothetical protein
MTEIPTWLLIVLVESMAVLLLVLGLWIFFTLRGNRRARQAIDRLVTQIRKQSKLRLEETGSFLEEKYRFEGDELSQAVEQVDRAEKLFFQRVINLYLKRDHEKLQSLDAWVAELIDVYKSLSPVMPAPGEAGIDEATQQKLDELESRRHVLEEELKITKATMAGMISEFGNMFGGGHDSPLDRSEVVEKVVNGNEVDPEKVTELLEQETPEAAAAATEPAPEPPPPPDDDEVLPEPDFDDRQPPAAPEPREETLTDDLAIEADDEIDDLLDGIDLSDGEELEPPK